MSDKLPRITLRPIGIVRNEVKEPTREGWGKVISEIVLDESLNDALDGLEKFSHVIVLYWMHRTAGQSPTKVRPQGNQELPLVGVFATRSPKRPNPIGKVTVRLIQRQGNILKVEGLDAIDGTPVLDIKPYIPGYDSAKNARVAPWVTRL
jgi:tRNA-Thr(GGU) m(6)t(6)A37 methyltransferase TsaA